MTSAAQNVAQETAVTIRLIMTGTAILDVRTAGTQDGHSGPKLGNGTMQSIANGIDTGQNKLQQNALRN